MNRPPKEIWAHPHDEEGWSRIGSWNVEFAWHEDEQLYVRADVADAAVAAALERAAETADSIALPMDGRLAKAQAHYMRSVIRDTTRSLASNPAEVAAIIKKAGENDDT